MLLSRYSIRKCIFLFCSFMVFHSAGSQNKSFDYSFYGFVRGDLYYNTRSNMENVDGLFYLYPRDISPDADGKDQNATPNSSFYTFTTRLGLNIKGPDIGSAKASAKIESDFGGTSNIVFMLRLRQAYVKLDWDSGSSLLLGQTWHPLFGEIIPDILNLSTGSPFQPFNRSPQLYYQYNNGGLKLKASAIYQLVYSSNGPLGNSQSYLKNGILPEIYLGADYKNNNFLIGAGVDMLSIKPRLQSVVNNNTFLVNERATSLSYDLHATYTHDKLKVSAKSLLASNLSHTVMLGGYGITDINSRTGEQKYTPFRHSTSWLNLVYGKKYQGGLFAGYTKNLGTSKELVNNTKYGMGLDMDQLTNFSFYLKHNLPHWSIGLEYTLTTAWYGETNLTNGKVINTHDVSNHRIESVFVYTF